MGHEAQRRAADPRQPPHRVLVPWVLRRVVATTTSIGFAVAAYTVTISGTSRSVRKTLIGYASFRKTTKKWPAPTARAFFAASALRLSSFPSTRTRHGPEASQNATPNLIPGTEPTSASYTSSAVLMKWV